MIPDLTNHRVQSSKTSCGVCGNWGKDCMSSCNPHGSVAQSSRTSHQAQMNTTETCKSRPILSLSPSHLDGLGTTGKRRARASNPTLAVPRVHVYILVDEASERCLHNSFISLITCHFALSISICERRTTACPTPTGMWRMRRCVGGVLTRRR